MGLAPAKARRIAERICEEHGITFDELQVSTPRAGRFVAVIRELSVTLRDAGMKYMDIARLLNRDHSTIINAEKVGRGQRKSTTAFWTKHEDALIRKLAPDWAAVARETGRSEGSVATRARKYIFPKPPAPPAYTEEQIARAMELVNAGATYGEAAEAVGVKRRPLAKYLQRRGCVALRRATVDRVQCAKRREDLKPLIEKHLATIEKTGLSLREIAAKVGCGLSLVEYVSGLTRAEWDDSVVTSPDTRAKEVHISYLEACADELGAGQSNKKLRQLYRLRCEKPDDEIPESDSCEWRGRMPHISDYRSLVGSVAGMCADV